jgi:branched-chain amino acid transport system permease protein
MRWFRVGLFGLSAGMAGLAGALFAGLRENIGATDFQLFASLPLLLLAVVCGVTSVTGAALGGVFLMMLPVLQSSYPGVAGLAFAVIGFGAVALGRDPNGLANLAFGIGRRLSGVAGPLADRLPGLPARRGVAEADDAADDGPGFDVNTYDGSGEPVSARDYVGTTPEVGAHAAARG